MAREPSEPSPADAEVFALLREEYLGAPLSEDEAAADPVAQFRSWFDEIVALGWPLANGMTLATVDGAGRPSARVVLLKGYDERGFAFFSNYESRKAVALSENPHAALCFWWLPVKRQVRIEGAVERIAAHESDEYFQTRPRASNLSAMASPQSQVVADRTWLEQQVERARSEWADRALVRPSTWGGYRLVPDRFEFWQGREDRLHDRLCYTRQSAGPWQLERLAP